MLDTKTYPQERYGCWGGFPQGHAYDPGQCAEEVRADSGVPYQCRRKGGHGDRGLFCKQHARRHPAASEEGRHDPVVADSSDRPEAVWLFDRNRRRYRKDAQGRPHGSPIWREHWVREEIVGETSQSWVTRWGRKVPKKGGAGIAFDEAEIDRMAFVENHKHKIADQVLRIKDFDTLKAIADLLNYSADLADG